MLNRITLCLIMTFLVLINFSCTKLTEEKPVKEENIVVEKLPDKDSIPASWGKLVSVSSSPDVSRWVQLWFEDKEGNIRMIDYNIIQNRLARHAKVFRRK